MKLYRVGGCVRDRLLGLPVNDIDWVVTGATAAQMLAAGYKSIGKDFPVFLHPENKQEYALARSERKIGPGYRGFEISADPATTIEQDLMRRDLTINAIAEDEQGNIVDPYDGRRDIEARKLRHVSAAFVEDPVRVLRIARFAARFHQLGFTLVPETRELIRQMGRSVNWMRWSPSACGLNYRAPWTKATRPSSLPPCATAKCWPSCFLKSMPFTEYRKTQNTTRKLIPACM